MKNFIKIAALCSFLTIPVSVHADVLSYQEVTEINKQAGNTIPVFEIGDGAGTTVYMVERSDHFYINVKEVNVYASPGNTSNILGILKNGMEVDRTAVCSNGWSKVYWIDAGTKFSGYVPDSVLCEKHKIESVSETKVIAQDCEILDYPSKKDGEVSGKVSASQEVTKIEAIDSNWSKVSFSAENGEIVEGYILNSMFEPDEDEVPEDIVNTKEETTENTDDISGETAEDTEATSDKTAEDTEAASDKTVEDTEAASDKTVEDTDDISDETTAGTEDLSNETLDAKSEEVEKENKDTGESSDTTQDNEDETNLDNEGSIHKSGGDGLFAEAVEAVPEVKTSEAGVQIGTPIAVSSDASLVPLGKFRITHYCPCSICCGPWANGITSTGVTATTNHTIAVNPSQIPYGSKVVVNGQVYVAEDCGGGITDNCIDIYVATHEEGDAKGMFYTDVYLLQD